MDTISEVNNKIELIAEPLKEIGNREVLMDPEI